MFALGLRVIVRYFGIQNIAGDGKLPKIFSVSRYLLHKLRYFGNFKLILNCFSWINFKRYTIFKIWESNKQLHPCFCFDSYITSEQNPNETFFFTLVRFCYVCDIYLLIFNLHLHENQQNCSSPEFLKSLSSLPKCP